MEVKISLMLIKLTVIFPPKSCGVDSIKELKEISDREAQSLEVFLGLHDYWLSHIVFRFLAEYFQRLLIVTMVCV